MIIGQIVEIIMIYGDEKLTTYQTTIIIEYGKLLMELTENDHVQKISMCQVIEK
jgi:hypothetical protein